MIIDVHTHAFPDFLADKAMNALAEHSGPYKPFTDGTVGGLLASMDEAGVDKSFIANIATKPEQAEAICNWSKEVHSSRIIPLGSVHPDSPHWEQDIARVKEAGLPGIKLHPMYQNFFVDEKRMMPFYECVFSHNLFILFHAGYDIAFPADEKASPGRIRKVLESFPQQPVIAGHLGGWQYWETVCDELAGEEVYFETSFISEVHPEALATLFRKHGTEFWLFGSDSPWENQIEDVRITDNLLPLQNVKEALHYKNAVTLCERVGYSFLS